MVDFGPCRRSDALHGETARSQQKCAENIDKEMYCCVPAFHKLAITCMDRADASVNFEPDQSNNDKSHVDEQHKCSSEGSGDYCSPPATGGLCFTILVIGFQVCTNVFPEAEYAEPMQEFDLEC